MKQSARLLIASAFLLLSLTHGFQSVTRPTRTSTGSSTLLQAWSLPTPTTPLTFGTWYQECHPTARKTSYLDDLPLEYNFSYDDWPVTDADEPSTKQAKAGKVAVTGPFKRVAKFASRFRRRSE
ncbi:hypothetical protein MPSEU_000277200 [Mayamaea pseudoterrestris]|nr:hypothetical protein MPSEU_000277200 [Mayamaea pseudoterrestris]